MGNLTESQALRQLQRVVYKLRYRIKWKVKTDTGKDHHGNGLIWYYIVDTNVVKVKTASEDFKVDQLYYKLAFSKHFNLSELFQRWLKEKRRVAMISNTCLRLYLELPKPVEEEEYPPVLDTTAPVWEVGLELERELERELGHTGPDNSRYATCIIYSSGKVAILGCRDNQQARLTYDTFVNIL